MSGCRKEISNVRDCQGDVSFTYPERKMLSNESPRFSQLEDSPKASWPQRSSPSPSQRRPLNNVNYSDDMEDLLTGGLGHRQVLGSAPS